MPTLLPPRRRRPRPQPQGDEERDGAGDTLVPVLIIVVLLMANVALYCEKHYPPLPGYALAASPADLQLSP